MNDNNKEVVLAFMVGFFASYLANVLYIRRNTVTQRIALRKREE